MRIANYVAVLALASAPAGAQSGGAAAPPAQRTGSTLTTLDPDRIAGMIINEPGVPQVSGAKARLLDDTRVQGGKALRIEVGGKGKNAWDVSIGGPVKKPVKAGDTILLAFWARLEKG